MAKRKCPTPIQDNPEPKAYVLFSCPDSSSDEHYTRTGYIGKDGLTIVEDKEDARRFKDHIDDWIAWYNEEFDWKFHAVRTLS